MKKVEEIQALERFIDACNEMLMAQNHLAVITHVDFSGVYMNCYDAKEIAKAWLEKLENNE